MSSPDDTVAPVQPERRLEADDSLRPSGLDLPTAAVFLAAGRAFAELVAAVPADAWDRPALGEWDVRALVGHAGRGLTTLVDYLGRPSDEAAEVADAAAYFARGSRLAAEGDLNEVVRQRGIAAGAALGADPAATVRGWLDDARAALASVTGDPVIPTALGRMRVSAYLPTRSFELTTHSVDLAVAVGLPAELPEATLLEAVGIAAAVGVLAGHGPTLLLALTGRRGLPAGFSVVP